MTDDFSEQSDKKTSAQSSIMGVWNLDLENGDIIWDKSMDVIYGITDKDPCKTYDLWCSKVHPDDLETIDGAFQKAITDKSKFEGCFRIKRQNGEVRHIRAFAAPYFDPDGTLSAYFGANIDETALHKQTVAKQKSAKMLQAITNLQSSYIMGETDLPSIFKDMLTKIRELSSSEFGFIGQIFSTDDLPERSMKIHAVRDISLNETTQQFDINTSNMDIVFQSSSFLIDTIIKKGNAVIINQKPSPPSSDNHSAHHPVLKRFMGIPLYSGNELVGIVGLANRKDAYDPSLIDELKPYLLSAAHIIKADQIEKARQDGIKRLIAAVEEAEKANLAKSQFLSNISHEIRTPLNGILGFANILYDQESQDQPKEFLGLIKTSANILIDIINDILDLAKIDSGKMELESNQFTLKEIEIYLDRLWTPQFASKNIIFKVDSQITHQATLVGDKSKFLQIMTNLIGNALKFTQKGNVTVSFDICTGSDPHQAELSCSVKDTGIGVPQETIRRLFKPFEQADASTTRQYGGTGLGLAICKQFIELMGGSISMESQLGQGSRFDFTVKVNIESAQKKLVNADNPISDATPDDVSVPFTNQIQDLNYMHDRFANDHPIPNGPSILGVEDNYINRIFIEHLLKSYRCTIDLVENGQIALEAIQSRPYDLVLMDIQMPVMDGIEATKRIRSLDTFSAKVPIIATTANAMKGEKERLLSIGMTDYISKPIEGQALINIIESTLGVSLLKIENAPDWIGGNADSTVTGENSPSSELCQPDNLYTTS